MYLFPCNHQDRAPPATPPSKGKDQGKGSRQATGTKTPQSAEKTAPLLMSRKNVFSRAYHRAEAQAQREGLCQEAVKQRAREAAQAAVAAM